MGNNYLDLVKNSSGKVVNGTTFFVFIAAFFFMSCANMYGQCNAEDPKPFISTNYDNLSVSKSTSGLCLIGCGVFNEGKLIDASLTNFATASFGALGLGTTHNIRVTDNNSTYTKGTFVGFKIGPNTGLLSVDLLKGIRIRTYLDNVLQDNYTGSSLVGLTLLSSATDYIVGFNSSKDFDAIEITLSSGASVLSSTKIYHAVIREYCLGPDLNCNTVTRMNLPIYPMVIDQDNTGFSGVSVGSISNREGAISASTTDYASITITAGLLATANFAIKDQITNYPAGTYAGLEIENTALLNLAALGNVTIRTYLDGVPSEEYTGNNLVANVSLLAAGGRFKLGFVSTKMFDEVKLIINQVAGVSLATTRVYGAVFEKFCAGPTLPCNIPTSMVAPTYPVYVNTINSGIDGIVCALCTVTDVDNLIDTDLTNFAQINLAAAVGASGSLSVKDQITDYPVGTFAGYTIETPSLLNVGALNAITIRTYLNGVLQESKSGNGPLVSVGTDILVGSSKQTIGFVSTKSFDEVRITLNNLVSVNLGSVKVYTAVFQNLCVPVVECNTTYNWSNPSFPVIIDADKTGINGVACVSCAVNATQNLLTPDPNDFANISLAAGVLGSGSVAVKDVLYTYPKGTFAGFVIKDLGTLAQVNLLQSLRIETYNDGILQESKSAGQLIDLSLLGLDVLGSVPGNYSVGFKTSVAFDEIRLTLNSIASVINSINVYSAFVNTSESNGGSLACTSSSIAVAKDGFYVDANADGVVNIGDRIDYTFVVTNTGNQTVTNIRLSDEKAVITGGPIASLSAGSSDSTTFTGTYSITQNDIDAAVVYNSATITGITPIGTAISATSTDPTPCTVCPVNPTCSTCTATALIQTPAIRLVKTASVSGVGAKGDVITYGFTVTNTGNTTLKDIVVSDSMPGLTFSSTTISSLPVGASNTTIVGSKTITQADVDAGRVSNTALVTGKDPLGNTISDVSGTAITNDIPTVVIVNQRSSIALVKTASTTGNGGVGDTINYTFAITNTGTTTLTNSSVTDAMVGLTVTGSPIATLAPGATNLSIKGTYTIRQSDVDLGMVTNSAVVISKDPQNNDVTDISGTTITTDDATETPVGQRSTIALVKTASVGGTGALGDTITYTFEVTNTGSTTLTSIVVLDEMAGLNFTSTTIATLDPGESDASITATYVIKQSDIDAGIVSNSAKVTARDPLNNEIVDISGSTIGTNDRTETLLIQEKSLTLIKTATYPNSGTTAILGDKITYSFEVENTGNVTVNNVVINDAKIGLSNLVVGTGILLPAAKVIIVRDYFITQADIDSGKVVNSAIVKGQDPEGNDVIDISGTAFDNDDSTVTDLINTSSIALVKTAIVSGSGGLGDVITYTFTATNIGTTTLSNVVVTDPMTGLVLTGNPIATLAVGTSDSTIKGTYTITQADIDAGKVSNSALATAQNPQGTDITDISGTTIGNNTPTDTSVQQTSSIALVKTATVSGSGGLGDLITYTFTVTNTGTTTLSNIIVTDPMTGLVLTGNPIATLAVGTSDSTIKGTYTITQADIDAGKVSNSALATAQNPQGTDITDISGTAIGNNTPTDTSVQQTSSIALVKTATLSGSGVLGDLITYTFTVANTGTTTLSNIVVTDPMTGLVLTGNPIATLAVGTSDSTITGTYTITQADIDAGKVSNSALATAQNPQGTDITDVSGTTIGNNTPTDTSVQQTSSIALVKTATVSGSGGLGDVITYTFTVTNTGTTTLSNVVVTDPMTGLVLTGNPIATLTVGTSDSTIKGTYTITQADIDAGKVSNSALATAQNPQGTDITDISGTTIGNNTPTDTSVQQTSGIALVKTATVSGSGGLGDVITYIFTVANTGTTTLSNVVVTDPMTGLVLTGNPIAILAVGTSDSTIKGTYTITQADIDAGKVSNSALATAQNPQGTDITDISGTTISTDDVTIIDITPKPSIAITADGVYVDTNGDGITNVGDHIRYNYIVRNTGNTELSNVRVTDNRVAVVGGPLDTFAPNSSNGTTFSALYPITQADIEAGIVYNLATVVGTSPDTVEVTNTSTDPTPCTTCTVLADCLTCTMTPLVQNPKIALMLKGEFQDDNSDGQAQIGETILYTYTVMNLGNISLSNLEISDSLMGAITIPDGTTIAVGGTMTFSVSYRLTREDIIAGRVVTQSTSFGTTAKNLLVSDLSDDNSPLEDDPTIVTFSSNCVVRVYNAVSPDGDGFNDFLRIDGLDCYTTNTVQIFDRWGVKVFDVDSYDNVSKVFRGISEGRVTINQSKGLPTGTYFYVVKYSDATGAVMDKSGYLHLIND